MDRNGIIFRCNANAEELSGYDRESLVGKSVTHLFSSKMEMIDVSNHIQEQLRKDRSIKNLELQLKHRTGRKIWVSLSIDPIRDKMGKLVELRAIAVDINQRKILEKRLLQAQKMEAIGTLTGGIAHDFNNLLSPVSGYAELLLMEAKENNYNTRNIEVIMDCVKHAKSLVNQMLTFSKKKEPQLKLFKASKSVEEALSLVRSFLPATIKIDTDINKESGLIKADPVQIHQVMMNLITNAFHAMEEEGGRLIISLEELFFKEEEKPELPAPGSYIQIRIEDTGCGIDPASLNNIFDPYYTTKKEGKGTGLGLSVVHGIINNHGGHIEVESHKGEGTAFTIFLPVFHGDVEMEEQMQNDIVIQMGTESILLVDDDENVLMMETQMLEKLGYTVSCHHRSDIALKTFIKDPDRFDVLVTDMTMPDMTGFQLADEIQKVRPGLPVILCTGFGEHVETKDFHKYGIKKLLNKPVAIKDFSFTLRAILDTKHQKTN